MHRAHPRLGQLQFLGQAPHRLVDCLLLAAGHEARIAYAALCSIVETGRRNRRSALTAIRDALAPPAVRVAPARPAHAG
jgi:hypothetical protein